MSCIQPLQAWEVADVSTGEVSIVFKMGLPGFVFNRQLQLPCGQCSFCRRTRSRDWAARCLYEASLYEKNCFVTLTYDESHLPADGSLKKKHFQDFMKRLRSRHSDRTIRFFQCGEYGPRLLRPHYHALLFNFDFDDKYFWKEIHGENYFRSNELESLWTFGFSLIGSVSFGSASYVASYITKKITGKLASKYYGSRLPEYCQMSTDPGLAMGWYNRWKRDVFPSDEIIIKGMSFKPPRYFDKLLEKEKPAVLEKIKQKRLIKAEKLKPEQTYQRRKARLGVFLAEQKRKKRSYENGSI